MATSTTARAAARRRIDRSGDALVRMSERLHADPELAWEEHRAAALVPELLDEAGFEVTAGYLGLDTAFRARFGSGPNRIAFCAEYDALPGLGHACGHNLIAAMSVGAALGLAKVADDAGITVEVYGTPAEEGGGGKIELLDRGAFAGVDLAMMAHPAPVDVAEARPFAVSHSKVSYRGRSAHAAALPGERRQRGGRLHRRAGRHRPAAPAASPEHARARRRHPWR
jgi:amidohydrolase